jgi:hypothetical protein
MPLIIFIRRRSRPIICSPYAGDSKTGSLILPQTIGSQTLGATSPDPITRAVRQPSRVTMSIHLVGGHVRHQKSGEFAYLGI